MKVKQSSFRIIFINEFKFKIPISDKWLRNDKCIGTLLTAMLYGITVTTFFIFKLNNLPIPIIVQWLQNIAFIFTNNTY